MFQPWKGSKYDVTRLLILGESPFSWWEDDELRHPLPQHFIEMFKWAIDSFPDCGRFFAMVSRGLANEENPSKERLKFVWDRAAFTNYVSGTVGDGSVFDLSRPCGTRQNRISSRQFFRLMKSNKSSPSTRAPVGRKIAIQLPQLMQQSVTMRQSWGRQVGARAVERIRAVAKQKGNDL